MAPGGGAPFGIAASPGADGITVRQVFAGSVAERSGLQAGDVITAIDGDALVEIPPDQIRSRLGRPGAELMVKRGSERTTVTVIEP